jgi:hypothetical protein
MAGKNRRVVYSTAVRRFLYAAGACLGTAALSQVVVEVLRHRSYLKHRGSGYVPSTQNIVLWGLIPFAVFTAAAAVFLTLAVFRISKSLAP